MSILNEKKMVIIKHLESPGHYLFLVPPYEYGVDAGDLVMCDTKRGPQFGVCLCDAFKADPEVICKYFNTSPKAMRYVIAVFNRRDLSIPKEEEEQDDNEDGQPE